MLEWKRRLVSGIGPEPRRVLEEVTRRRLTYLNKRKLERLSALCQNLERQGDDGDIVEAGCALGGSAILLCASKAPSRPLRVYDVFGQIPPPTESDGRDVHDRYHAITMGHSVGLGPDTYYGYQDDLYDKVKQTFADLGYPVERHNTLLIKGLLQDTLDVSGPIGLAHVDVDWYEPVKVCLERIVPHLTAHGAIVLDDFGTWSGCRKATLDFFSLVGRSDFEFMESDGHLVVCRRMPRPIRG